MTKLRVLVCDDDKRRADGWVSVLETVTAKCPCAVAAATVQELKDSTAELRNRQRAARPRGRRSSTGVATCQFDHYDVAFIDYDLLRIDHLDGETLAYLARCFSEISVLIVVNRDRGDVFDLRLGGDPQSWSEVDISDRQLGNAGLWEEPWEGFRPWHWPLIPDTVSRFKRNVKKFVGLLDDPLETVLAMPEGTSAILPAALWEFVTHPKKGQKTTLRELVLASQTGVRTKDRITDENAIARIGVARLTRWLTQGVLPGEHLLVDAPHLVSRVPGLVTDSARSSADKLSQLCVLSDDLPSFFDASAVRRYGWNGNGLLDRPTWWWPSIAKDMKIPDIKEPWNAKTLDFVFCEDISRFVPRSAARQFAAEILSPYSSRFVVNADGTRLPAGIRKAVKGVSYEPASRFAI
jgi:hypothetical protein